VPVVSGTPKRSKTVGHRASVDVEYVAVFLRNCAGIITKMSFFAQSNFRMNFRVQPFVLAVRTMS